MAGLVGVSTVGVGKDIIDYLTAVNNHYSISIKVTSGKRNASEQGVAMFNNWFKASGNDLKRGKVYKKTTLPDADRLKLDGYYKTAKEDKKAKLADKAKAEKAFKKLASDKVGTKSKHVKGRAVDVAKVTVPKKAYTAITKKMKEVKEGRADIYHFESTATIPAVTEAMKKTWPAK